MALLYAKPVEYAIRALTYLAGADGNKSVSVVEIAEHEGISSHHLSKVMKSLAKGKLVRALRGPGGGYRLIADPKQINVWDVMGCLSSQEAFSECAIGWAQCCDDNPCPLHTRWVAVRGYLVEYLKEATIADLATAAKIKQSENQPIQIVIPLKKTE